MQWYVDFVQLGTPPTSLWELDADMADEVRFLLQHVELPEDEDGADHEPG